MRIAGTTALVSGGNRGLGLAICRSLIEHGAARVYAGAREPDRVTDLDLVPVALDITDPASVAAAARQCPETSIVVNNAGVAAAGPIAGPGSLNGARDLMETNFFGTWNMCHTFAPILAKNGGGAMVNILSIVSFFAPPEMTALSATKAASWSLTNGLRMELRDQGTLVMGVHPTFVDTDLAVGFPGPKLAPADVANAVAASIEAGQEELLLGDRTREVKTALSRDQELIYPEVEAQWRASCGRS